VQGSQFKRPRTVGRLQNLNVLVQPFQDLAQAFTNQRMIIHDKNLQDRPPI
jgi:hypothetical protein